MKTIKLPYESIEADLLISIMKQYSIVVRYSYNRFLENKFEKEVRHLTKSLKSIELLNSWLIVCAIGDGNALHQRFKDKKKPIIFCEKYNFINRIKHKISKEEFDLKRCSNVNICGEKLQRGNRLFELDIVKNNQIIFKLNRNKYIELKLPRLRNNIKTEL